MISFGELGVSGDGWVPACNRIVEGWDARVYAISPSNAAFLQRICVWKHLDQARIAPIHAMKIFGDAGAELQAGRQLGLGGSGATGLADLLVQQVFEAGAVALESGGVGVGQVVGDHGHARLLRVQSGLGDPEGLVHGVVPRGVESWNRAMRFLASSQASPVPEWVSWFWRWDPRRRGTGVTAATEAWRKTGGAWF